MWVTAACESELDVSQGWKGASTWACISCIYTPPSCQIEIWHAVQSTTHLAIKSNPHHILHTSYAVVLHLLKTFAYTHLFNTLSLHQHNPFWTPSITFFNRLWAWSRAYYVNIATLFFLAFSSQSKAWSGPIWTFLDFSGPFLEPITRLFDIFQKHRPHSTLHTDALTTLHSQRNSANQSNTKLSNFVHTTPFGLLFQKALTTLVHSFAEARHKATLCTRATHKRCSTTTSITTTSTKQYVWIL